MDRQVSVFQFSFSSVAYSHKSVRPYGGPELTDKNTKHTDPIEGNTFNGKKFVLESDIQWQSTVPNGGPEPKKADGQRHKTDTQTDRSNYMQWQKKSIEFITFNQCNART
jgi:hypothetical protein